MIEGYWASATAHYRAVLVETLRRYAFDSVLEVGCHCGPVLKTLRDAFGDSFHYTGLDVNEGAIYAARSYHSLDRRAQFLVHDIRDVVELSPVDLVLSSSCLMHIEPADLDGVLAWLRPLAQTAFVAQEPVGHGQHVDGQGWLHAYPDWMVTC